MNKNEEKRLTQERLNLKKGEEKEGSLIEISEDLKQDAKEEARPILYDVEFSSGMFCRNINYKIQVRIKVSPDAEDGEKTILALFEKCMLEFTLSKDGNFLGVVEVSQLPQEVKKEVEK